MIRLPHLPHFLSRALAWGSHPRIVRAVRRDRLSYLDAEALTELHEAVAQVEGDGLAGVLIEAGCALGGSAIVMADAKSPRRPLFVYDVFGMAPPPSENDEADLLARYELTLKGGAKGIRGARYYGYEQNLLGVVEANFDEHGLRPESNAVHFVRGLFEDTLHPPGPVALAHLDGLWHDSVRTSLERIVPSLVPAGRLIIDDYDRWTGCRKAVDDYFANGHDGFTFERHARLHVIRNPIEAPVAGAQSIN